MLKKLQDVVRSQLDFALDARAKLEMMRAHQGLPPSTITICLGPGRCMVPEKDDGTAKYCPFCMTYPSGPGSDTRKEEIARRIISGN